MRIGLSASIGALFNRAFHVIVCIKRWNTFDPGCGIHDLHIRVRRFKALQPNGFKLDANGKVKLGVRQVDHLLRTGFIGVRIVAAANHRLALDAIPTNLVHKPLLRQNADGDGQLIGDILGLRTGAPG